MGAGLQSFAIKHCGSKAHLDVMSNKSATISDEVTMPLFIIPGDSVVEGAYPRIETVVKRDGYIEGFKGAIQPRYLSDALEVGKYFKSIRFFTKEDDTDAPLLFVLGNVGDLDCFGGIMKLRDSFDLVSDWLPKPAQFELASEFVKD
jgi:hypothetical protein